MKDDETLPLLDQPIDASATRADLCDALRAAMQQAGFLEDPPPPAALRWIETFVAAYSGRFATMREALLLVAALRAEAALVPALALERLRTRNVIFFLDTVGQYVDDQPELRDLPLEHDVAELAHEFGLERSDAEWAIRMALTGEEKGPPLELLFPLLGHDRILIRLGAISSHLLHGRGLEPIKYGPDGKPFAPIPSVKPNP